MSIDDEAVRTQAMQARRLGVGGKAYIHPRQLSGVAEAFTHPTWHPGHRGLAAAGADGAGAISPDVRMIDVPVARRAK